MTDKARTINIRGVELPAGAMPANRVKVKNKKTGEERMIYTIDWREYDRNEWEEVGAFTGKQIAKMSNAAPAAQPAQPEEDDEKKEEKQVGDNDPWVLWTDAEMRKAAAEAGVKRTEKMSRAQLADVLEKKGVEPTDDKPQ